MISRRYAAVIAPFVVAAGAVSTSPPAHPVVDPCPDVEVIFARGTGEPAGLGRVGQAFVEALKSRLGERTVAASSVDYPASFDFLMAADGADNAAAQIAAVASRCRNTKIVLGGYSQGAALVDMLAGVPPLGDVVGDIGSAPYLARPFADKVSATAVFGNPSARFGTPLSTTGLFEGKAIDLCNPGDPICSPTGTSVEAHENYEYPPYLNEAADFVAGILK